MVRSSKLTSVAKAAEVFIVYQYEDGGGGILPTSSRGDYLINTVKGL